MCTLKASLRSKYKCMTIQRCVVRAVYLVSAGVGPRGWWVVCLLQQSLFDYWFVFWFVQHNSACFNCATQIHFTHHKKTP